MLYMTFKYKTPTNRDGAGSIRGKIKINIIRYIILKIYLFKIKILYYFIFKYDQHGWS
jgi:hypothetical protein